MTEQLSTAQHSTEIKHHPFPHRYPVVPVPVVETVLYLLNVLTPLTTDVRVNF